MTKIIKFATKSTATRTAPAKPAGHGVVVNLSDWRKRAHPLRTSSGVFFVTNVIGTPGDAA